MSLRIALLTWTVVAAGCAHCHTCTCDSERSRDVATLGAPSAPGSPDEAGAMTLVFFGMATADGGEVSEAEWSAFVAEVLTPRFPDGLTVLSGAGQYQPADGSPLVREQAKIVLLVHDGSADAHRRIEEAAGEYRRRFEQEAVLRATTDIRVAP